MKTVVINFKVDPKLKSQAQARAQKLGVPLSFVLTRQPNIFTAGGKVEIPAEPMSSQMEKIIARAEQEIAAGQTSGPFDNVEAFMAHLDCL